MAHKDDEQPQGSGAGPDETTGPEENTSGPAPSGDQNPDAEGLTIEDILGAEQQRDEVDVLMRARAHLGGVGVDRRVMEQAQHRIAVLHRGRSNEVGRAEGAQGQIGADAEHAAPPGAVVQRLDGGRLGMAIRAQVSGPPERGKCCGRP